ncbi:MAG: hypothetical protein BWK78_00760 [Thiotrichaceae bacterium IS1]|nr:MAG: hypothetical protein BWK78_00760 [Thiotrichaceae bacterium IS1]
MVDSFKTMSAQEYSDLFSKLREQDDKFGTVGELNKVFAQKLIELLQVQEGKFDTVSELHKIFAQKFAEYDAEIQSLRTRIVQLEGK